MDYGNTNDPQKFEFDQLNLDTDEMSWDSGATPSRDPRALGNKAISTPGNTPGNVPINTPEPAPENTPNGAPNNLPESVPGIPNTPENQLGQIVNLEMPPGVEMPEMPDSLEQKALAEAQILAQTIPLDAEAIKTDDQLDPRAVKIVDDAIHKLDQDGNVADFYDAARDMMETNLENSYHRKLAA